MAKKSENTSAQFTVALLSVIAFCSIGIAVTAGYISISFAKDSRPTINLALADASNPKSANPPATSVAPDQQVTPVKKSLTTKKKPQKKTIVKKTDDSEVASEDSTKETETIALCVNCGVVDSVRVIEKEREASGLGAVAGGIVGALLGNQVGRGSGRKIATVAGAAGGAYAGHQVEKNVRTSQVYEINVRMDDGSLHTFTEDKDSGFRAGEKVKVENGIVVRN